MNRSALVVAVLIVLAGGASWWILRKAPTMGQFSVPNIDPPPMKPQPEKTPPFAEDLAAVRRESSITLGAELKLGMPQAEVLEKLADYYEVRKSVPGAWQLLSKNGPPFESFGSVTFHDGRLTYVSKEWGPTNQQRGVEFATALYGALANLTAQKETLCWISTLQNMDPAGEMRQMWFTCGGKTLDITVVRDRRYGNHVTMSEILQR